MAGDRNFVLMKRGLYWGPNYSGYVGSLAMAGRYTETEARSRLSPEGSRPAVTMHRVEDCHEFSPSCWPETQIEVLRRERDEARASLRAIERRAAELVQAAYGVDATAPSDAQIERLHLRASTFFDPAPSLTTGEETA